MLFFEKIREMGYDGIEKSVLLHALNELPCGVMVAQQILVLFVWVRVLSGQLTKAHETSVLFLCSI